MVHVYFHSGCSCQGCIISSPNGDDIPHHAAVGMVAGPLKGECPEDWDAHELGPYEPMVEGLNLSWSLCVGWVQYPNVEGELYFVQYKSMLYVVLSGGKIGLTYSSSFPRPPIFMDVEVDARLAPSVFDLGRAISADDGYEAEMIIREVFRIASRAARR